MNVLPEEFMNQLQGALEREAQGVAQKIGIPLLQISQAMDDNGQVGQIIWNAGVQLSEYLNRELQPQLEGRRVLELGSGTGLVGIVAAVCGANVTVTDLPEVLPRAMENVALNQQLISDCGGAIAVTEYDWNKPSSHQLDPSGYDFVVGADLVYDPEAVDPLTGVLQRLLTSQPQTEVLLAHQHRSNELDHMMFTKFLDAGLNISVVSDRREEEHITIYKIYKP